MNSTRIKTAEEGFNKVHEQGQKFAFLWDVAIIEYKILTDQDCSLTTVKVRKSHLIKRTLSDGFGSNWSLGRKSDFASILNSVNGLF